MSLLYIFYTDLTTPFSIEWCWLTRLTLAYPMASSRTAVSTFTLDWFDCFLYYILLFILYSYCIEQIKFPLGAPCVHSDRAWAYSFILCNTIQVSILQNHRILFPGYRPAAARVKKIDRNNPVYRSTSHSTASIQIVWEIISYLTRVPNGRTYGSISWRTFLRAFIK